MSSRKAAALRAIREARSRKEQGLGVAPTDIYEVKDEGDVYEYVDEHEYQQLVESRRQREDFVVDDDGLGYYDDGEERLGDEEEVVRNKKRPGATANLTAAALKRARKTNAMLADKRKQEGNTEDDAPGAAKNASMWDFVQRGAVSTSTVKSAIRSNVVKNPRSLEDLDSLIDALDASPATNAASNRRPRAGRSYGRASHHATRPSAFQGQSTRPQTRTPNSQSIADHEQMDNDSNDYIHDNEDDWGGDDADQSPPKQRVGSPTKQNDVHSPSVKPTSGTIQKSFIGNVEMDNNSPPKLSGAGQVDNNVARDDELEQIEASEKPNPEPNRLRKRFATAKLSRISAPALVAREQQQASSGPTERQNPAIESFPASAPFNVDTSSASFKPETIANEALPSGFATDAPDLESFVKEQDGEPYLDMFWIDAVERNGDILLFGKIQMDIKLNKSPSSFVSCCAVVKNNLRNLFVLPKRKNDSEEYESMMDIHNEIKSVLQPSCIPHVAGASWAGKIVKRKYAFEDPTIPRDQTQYFKVVYDAKYPVPASEICTEGGKYFQRILGAGASTLESFILKRKLMGPCWIRISNPSSNSTPASWCKLELQVENPKNICRLDLVETGSIRPPPPIVTMSFKLKTVVNPKTHKSEIVSVSAVCHKQVQLDSASDESSRYMTQISLIRPLGTAATSSGNNTLPHFPRDIDQEIKMGMPQLQRMPNERALLSRLFAQIGTWDPDVIVGHNAFGFDLEVLLSRCVEHKVSTWSKIGRRRKMQLPSKTYFSSGKDWPIVEALAGRLLCDTYLCAKDILRETTYSLTNLAATQLKAPRTEIDPIDVPQWFNASKTIVQLANHTLNDALLVQRLMFHLQILPLTKQLTCVAGNLWARTMKGNRAERNEYLLLHEFHQLKFILPEKKKSGGMGQVSKGAKYSGGLVLEPKKGLYDSFILLLDFNSLYPSIIQEYNLCFTTMNWSSYVGGTTLEQQGERSSNVLPPLPDESNERGVLPRVIKSLVERRRAVKKMMTNESNMQKKEELDIRQKALKLTANSMYGCLGFSHSRFFAQPIAALVTAMGRETLQRTVDVAQETVGLEVIYGDTDSIMINTRINDPKELKKVKELGEKVKREVNRLYRTLELEIDGVFRSMLLLKKKKYAAVTVAEGRDGELIYGKETKGLDQVRRDWCIQSKDTGRFVLDQILSQQDKESVTENIYNYLEGVATKMRNGELPMEKYVITKGLSKHPNDYPDGKSQPHVQVAKAMLKNNRPVNTGDHIPYIITATEVGSDGTAKSASVVERARHPEEIARSGGILKPDVEWYLTQQILPPVSRLIEPIEGMSQTIIAEKLGLDSSKYNHKVTSGATAIDDDNLVDYTPSSCLSDDERFRDVEKLHVLCLGCGLESQFPGVFYTKLDEATGAHVVVSGLQCVNSDCRHPEFWGCNSLVEAMARISNAVSTLVKLSMKKYYRCDVHCDDPTCQFHTVPSRQLSVGGPSTCLGRGCAGSVHATFPERELHNQLKYLDTLFDTNHACKQLEKLEKYGSHLELKKSIAKNDKIAMDELQEHASHYLRGSAFNWISPSFWTALFGGGGKNQALMQ